MNQESGLESPEVSKCRNVRNPRLCPDRILWVGPGGQSRWGLLSVASGLVVLIAPLGPAGPKAVLQALCSWSLCPSSLRVLIALILWLGPAGPRTLIQPHYNIKYKEHPPSPCPQQNQENDQNAGSKWGEVRDGVVASTKCIQQ